MLLDAENVWNMSAARKMCIICSYIVKKSGLGMKIVE